MKKLSLDIVAELEHLRKVNERLRIGLKQSRREYGDMLEIAHITISTLRREIGCLEAENLDLQIRLGLAAAE